MSTRDEPSRRRVSVVALAVAWALLLAGLAGLGLYVTLASPPAGLAESEPVAFALPPPAAEPAADRDGDTLAEPRLAAPDVAGGATQTAEVPAAIPEPEEDAAASASPPPPPPETR